MSQADDFAAHDLRLLMGWSDEEFAAWLLAAFDAHVADPLHLHDDRSVRAFVVDLARQIPTRNPQARTLVKRAAKRAVVDWRPPPANSYETLSGLAFLAADLGVSAAAGPLMTLVERVLRPASVASSRRSQASTTLGDVLAVLAGYIALDDVGEYLEHLFWDPTFGPRYSGLLLNALCRRSRLSTSRYLRRFVDVVQAHPDACDVELAIWKLVDGLSFTTIGAQLGSLDDDVRRLLLDAVRPLFDRRRNLLDVSTRGIFLAEYEETQTGAPVMGLGPMRLDSGRLSLPANLSRGAVEQATRVIDDYLSREGAASHFIDDLLSTLSPEREQR